jgi:hypothetical protein
MRFTPTSFIAGTGADRIKFITDGLVAYYDINSYNSSLNTWFDLTANSNNATVSGSALTLTAAKGWKFNGTNNHMVLPTFSGSTAITVMVWGDVNNNYTTRSAQVTETLFSKRVGTNNGFNSTHIFRISATADAITTSGQSGIDTTNQGFRGAATGSLNFIGFQSNESTQSLLYLGFGNAVSSSWIDGAINGWNSGGGLTTGSILFPYTQQLIFGSSSSGRYTGTVGILAVYNRLLTNDEMNTNYLAVSSSAVY